MNKRLLLPVLLVAGLVFCASNDRPAPSPTPLTPRPGLSLGDLVHGQLTHLALANTVVATTPANIPVSNASTVSVAIPVSVPLVSSHATYISRYAAKQDGNMAIGSDGTSYPLRSYSAAALPNDPQANQPWVTSANLSAAWNVPRGGAPTLLAIIDTGFALKHTEFAGRFYINPGETGPTTLEAPSRLNCTDRGLPLDKSCNLIDDNGDGIVDNETGPTTVQAPSQLNCTDRGLPLDKSCNLIDNDGDGFINDVTGWDFAYNNSSVQAGKITPSGSGTHHGTYVTGVAAATGNNGVGIAGVDWGTKILPIQALDDTGSGNTVSVANAINYAVDRHANVISLSLGSTTDDPIVHQAVRRAVAAGIVVVAAAGNDGCDCMLYPANYPEVVSVGAATSTGQPATFSSYGANLKILAPGVNLYTTDWQAGNPTSAYASGISGTSLATPVVSGLLTRLLSQQPTATAAQLIAALTESANHTGLTVAAPHSNSLGYGLLDAGSSSARMNTGLSTSLMYAYLNVSRGPTLLTPALENNAGEVYACNLGTLGTTPMYQLSLNGSTFFSTSTVENQVAISKGYASRLLAYFCTSQPQDRPSFIREINVNAEFIDTAF